jgi:HEAT repeat protein
VRFRSRTTALAFALLLTREALALDWPDVFERAEQGLASAHPATRKNAARELSTLDEARATPLVLRALEDSDVEVRLEAARSAASLGLQAATDVAASWLSESDARLRIAACELARAAPSPRVVKALARALGDSDVTVRVTCARALGASAASGASEAVAQLAGKLDDSSPNVRVEVARALARIGDERAVLPLVGKAQDSSPEVRQAILRALGLLGDPRASQALLLSLRDSASETKVEALYALGRLRATEAIDSIAPLSKDASPAVRNAALSALASMGTREAARVLVRALGLEDDAFAGLERTTVREALVRVGRAAEPELEAILSRPATPAIAASAAWVLGALRARAHAPLLVAALRRGTLEPSAALYALRDAGTSRELPVVLEFLGDTSADIRAQARHAAHAILNPAAPDGRAIEPILGVLKDFRPTGRERAELASLLGRTGTARAAPALIELANSADITVQIASIDALRLVASSVGLPALSAQIDETLARALRHSDSLVRVRAAAALSAVGGRAARESILTGMQGDEPLDRYAALTALGGVLSRHPDEKTIRSLLESYEFAAGGEREALLFAIARTRHPLVLEWLARTSRASAASDRRAVAMALAEQSGSSAILQTALRLVEDADPLVRAEAAFSLGTLGGHSELSLLARLSRDADRTVATNASAAISRLARRLKASSTESSNEGLSSMTATACELLSSARPTVRANALATLATLDARCAKGQRERDLLAHDSSELVRANAARALYHGTRDEDRAALARCVSTEPRVEVASRCGSDVAPSSDKSARTEWVTVFITEDVRGKSIQPGAPYTLEYGDGSLREGIADRRGAVVDPAAVPGELRLRR